MDSTVSPCKLFKVPYDDVVYHEKVKIEEDMKGLKVAVVGILGNDNSGKSFLINLMAQYLKNEETGSHGWLDGLIKNKKLITGFEMNIKWHQYSNLNNGGLYMWPRPFILKKPGDNNTEEKVAVILLDINMDQVSPSLQMLMCLLCSTVIYNTTTDDIFHLYRLITTIKKSCAPFFKDGKSYNFKDFLCQHFTLIFRDHEASEIKHGEDKPLKYLKSLKTPAMQKIIEEIETIPNINCFLLPKPEKGPLSNEGCIETDKKFTQHIKLLIQKTLTVDNLFLKTYQEKCLNLETFYSVGIPLCYMVIPELLREYNESPPNLETNVDEPMDTLNSEAKTADEHRSEEIAFSLSEPDIEMTDVSNSQHSIPCNDFVEHSFNGNASSPQYLVQSKVPESHFRETGSNFHSQLANEAFLASPGNAAKWSNSPFTSSPYTNNDEGENSQTRICEVEIRDTHHNRRETEVDAEKIDKRMNTEFEKFGATFPSTKIQAECNQETKKEKNKDSAQACKTTQNAHNLEVQSQWDEGIRMYNYSITKFLSSFPLSSEKLSEKHSQTLEDIKKQVSMDLFKTITPQLEEAYKSYQKQVEQEIANCKHAKQVLTLFETNFAKEYQQGLTSGSFFKTNVDKIIADSMEVSVDEYARGFADISKKSLLTVIYKLPETKNYSTKIENLQIFFKMYLIEMNKKLEMYNFFSDEQLTKFHSDAVNKSLQPFKDGGSQELLNIGVFVMKRQFEDINKKIVRCEENTFKVTIIPKVKNFYDVEMKNVTRKKMTSVQLTMAHETLKKECHQVVLKAGSFKESNIPLLKSCFEQLDKTLNSGLENHIQTNQMKMDKIQAKIEAAIRKNNVEYNETMAKKMGHKALSSYELANLHKECFNGAAGVLKLEIRSIDETEGLDRHIENLKMKTQSTLNCFIEENKNRCRKEEARIESEKREAKKQEAAEKKRQRDAQFKNEASNDTNINKNICNSFKDDLLPHQQYKAQSSPIIAIELGKKKIKAGIFIEGKTTLIPNCWSYLETDNHVATTDAGEILIGNEYIDRSDVKNDFDTSQLMDLSMKELIDSPLSEIDFHGQTISPKKEFLTGLILSRIKSDAENFLEQAVTSAVITVPLWYTSSLRQATKDAAIIAGFSTVHLINDVTAAAIAYANHHSRLESKNHFLIVHAVEDNIDIAVYSYSYGTVKMESCSGNLHGGGNDGIFKYCFKRFKKWRSEHTDKDVMEAIKSLITNCAKKYYNDIQEQAVIFEGSNNAYLDKLHDIVGHYGRHAKNPKPNEAILEGAARFGDLLNRQGSTPKLVNDDLLPYKIEYHKPGISNGQIIERYRPLVSKGSKQSITFDSYIKEVKILEVGNISLEPITTGYLYFNEQTINCGKKPPIHFMISSEGILKIDASSTVHIKKWDSFNLSDEDIAYYASLVTLCSPNPQQENEKYILEESKNQLKALAQLLIRHADEVDSVFGKDQIQARATASIEAANHPKITLEDVNNRTTVLTKLKTKYLASI